jgi:preprotein translocase subunit SecF
MGGIALHDFVFVMLIGVIKGTYSSIFIASPLVSLWHKIKKTVPEGKVVRSEPTEQVEKAQ